MPNGLCWKPRLGNLDETDSGLDIDALRIVAGGVNKLRSKNQCVHLSDAYQLARPYRARREMHVMANGRIIKSGPKELALELEEEGL